MDNTFKILIIIIIILVAGLSLAAGYIIFPLLNKQTAVNLTNNSSNHSSNSTHNQTVVVNKTVVTTKKVPVITAAEAEANINQYLSNAGSPAYSISANLESNGQVYDVLTYDPTTGKQMGYKYVNATNGQILT